MVTLGESQWALLKNPILFFFFFSNNIFIFYFFMEIPAGYTHQVSGNVMPWGASFPTFMPTLG
jgi:hypothetical protein